MRNKRIVILGAGFGGIYTYQELHKYIHNNNDIHVTIVSNSDHFLFTPLIHEVATGNLTPESVKQPVRVLPHCCINDFVNGTVKGIDLDMRQVTIELLNKDDELEHRVYAYDYLVSALGSQTEFFQTPGAEKYAKTLKSLDDATKLKNIIIENFEQTLGLTSAEDISDTLRVVIVGGGPTGVELAGEIADLVVKELRRAFPKVADSCEIVLIQRAERLVPQVDEWFSKKVCEILSKKGNVRILLKNAVEEVQEDGVAITDGFIHSRTIVWTAGVRATQIPMRHKRAIEIDERSKRIKVTNHLQIENYPEVFIIGDQAWVCDKENSQPYPQRAQFAVRQGIVAAQNVLNMIEGEKPKEFRWKDRGFILSLGKGGAFAQIMGLQFNGFLAWLMYRGAYVIKMIGLRAKIVTVVGWVLNLFLPRDISKY